MSSLPHKVGGRLLATLGVDIGVGEVRVCVMVNVLLAG
jgi:hypothetical protein